MGGVLVYIRSCDLQGCCGFGVKAAIVFDSFDFEVKLSTFDAGCLDKAVTEAAGVAWTGLVMP
jgi:hypothetical protein